MSSIEASSVKAEKRRHQNQLKSLVQKNQVEINKIKNEHERQKATLKVQNKAEINSVLNENEKKLLNVADKNERTLRNLSQSIEVAKDHARKEQENIKLQLASKKIDQKSAYDNHVSRLKEKYQFKLEDIEHQAQIELERLNNKVKNKKQELKDLSKTELATIKQKTENKKELNKTQFMAQRTAEENKYQRSLSSMRKHQKSTLAREEQRHQLQLRNKKENIDKEIKQTTVSGQDKISELQKKHEKNYQTNYKRTKGEMQNLLSRKEQIIDRFRQNMRKEVKLQKAKNEDSFYQFKEIDPKITKLPNKQGYSIEINLPKHEVENVRITADKRTLTLDFDRQAKEIKNYRDGSESRMQKVETLTSRIKVDDIIDPKSLEKSYSNGVLRFTYKLA